MNKYTPLYYQKKLKIIVNKKTVKHAKLTYKHEVIQFVVNDQFGLKVFSLKGQAHLRPKFRANFNLQN